MEPNGLIFAVLAGMPDDQAYLESVDSVFREFKDDHRLFSEDEVSHRRGDYAAQSFGISSGNGLSAPARLCNKGHGSLEERLRGSKHLNRVASYADCEFVILIISILLANPLVLSCFPAVGTKFTCLLQEVHGCGDKGDWRRAQL